MIATLSHAITVVHVSMVTTGTGASVPVDSQDPTVASTSMSASRLLVHSDPRVLMKLTATAACARLAELDPDVRKCLVVHVWLEVGLLWTAQSGQTIAIPVTVTRALLPVLSCGVGPNPAVRSALDGATAR